MPPPNHLSQMMQRIGKEFIAAIDKSSVQISADDFKHLKSVLNTYKQNDLDEWDYPFLCVFYTFVTCAKELGLPTEPMPAYIYLRAAYGVNALDKSGSVTRMITSSYADDVGYAKKLDHPNDNWFNIPAYFFLLGPNEWFMNMISNIDKGLDPEPPKPPKVYWPHDGTYDLKYTGGRSIEEFPDIDAGDCPVYLICSADDSYTESEIVELNAVLDAMPLDELTSVKKFVDYLFCYGLKQRRGRDYVRNHPLYSFTFKDNGIFTSRLYEIPMIAEKRLQRRTLPGKHFY